MVTSFFKGYLSLTINISAWFGFKWICALKDIFIICLEIFFTFTTFTRFFSALNPSLVFSKHFQDSLLGSH